MKGEANKREHILNELTKMPKRLSELEASEIQYSGTERRYRELIERSRDGYAMVDMEGKIAEFNSAIREMFGYTVEELLEKTNRDLTPNERHYWDD